MFNSLIPCASFRETGNVKSTMGWRPYGTPLVSPVSCDEIITRGDIQSMVHTMLSPMLRTESVGHPDISDTNTSLPASDPSLTTSTTEACTDSNMEDSVHRDGGSLKSATLTKLALQLVDENNACIDLSVGEDKAVKLSSSRSILVFIDWSGKLLKNYDTHYLENLPEVFRIGPVMKKARNEPLSLYTCLEAFLREEPLVPEDMWLVSYFSVSPYLNLLT